MGWVHRVTLSLQPFLIYWASPSDFLTFLICPAELSANYHQRYVVTKQEKLGGKWPLNFAYKISLSYSQGSLTCHKILQHGTGGFTSPPKVVLWIFIGFKNPSSSAGFEPAYLG
jgi:hypothetical protein